MLGLGVKVRPASLRLLRVRQWSLALTTPAVPLCLAALRSLEGEMRAARAAAPRVPAGVTASGDRRAATRSERRPRPGSVGHEAVDHEDVEREQAERPE